MAAEEAQERWVLMAAAMQVGEVVVLQVMIVQKRSARLVPQERAYAHSWELLVPVERVLAEVWEVRCCICKGRTHHHRQKLVLLTRAVREEVGVGWNDSVPEEQEQVEVEVGEPMVSIQVEVVEELKGYVTEEVVGGLEERSQGQAVREQAMPVVGGRFQMACVKLAEAWAVSCLAVEASVSILYQTWSVLM